MRVGLERHVVGTTITAVEVFHPRPVRRHPSGPEGFATALAGRRVVGARRRGKYLWLPLDNGDALLAHLGMSGQLLVQPAGAVGRAPPAGPLRPPGHARRGGLHRELRFVDQRMFGGLSISPGGAELPAEIAHIARDPLDPAFDEADVVRRVRRRSSGIKRLLLDQTLVSGVGNIYADEALWRSGLHGDRPGERLTGPQVRDPARPRAHGDARCARPGRHLLRRPLRQRQRSSRATSTVRCTPTGARASPASAAARPFVGSPS